MGQKTEKFNITSDICITNLTIILVLYGGLTQEQKKPLT